MISFVMAISLLCLGSAASHITNKSGYVSYINYFTDVPDPYHVVRDAALIAKSANLTAGEQRFLATANVLELIAQGPHTWSVIKRTHRGAYDVLSEVRERLEQRFAHMDELGRLFMLRHFIDGNWNNTKEVKRILMDVNGFHEISYEDRTKIGEMFPALFFRITSPEYAAFVEQPSEAAVLRGRDEFVAYGVEERLKELLKFVNVTDEDLEHFKPMQDVLLYVIRQKDVNALLNSSPLAFSILMQLRSHLFLRKLHLGCKARAFIDASISSWLESWTSKHQEKSKAQILSEISAFKALRPSAKEEIEETFPALHKRMTHPAYKKFIEQAHY